MRRILSPMPLLGGAIALALAFGALAQADSSEAKRKELEAARAELERAARKVAELSRELGEFDGRPMAFQHVLKRRPLLGVVLAPDAKGGARIAAVTPESGAAKAGLRSGDVIVAIEGQPIAGDDADARLARTRELLRELKADRPVSVTYERDGRRATAQVTPRVADDIAMFRFDRDGDVLVTRAPRAGRRHVEVIEGEALAPLVAPRVRTEILTLGPDGACAGGAKGKDGEKCRIRVLSEAFRWSGLNLASVDERLGRYFGTDSGVLVLSAGEGLEALQPGDVIRKVDGKPVSTPREAMDALRGKPEGSRVSVEYLRDRRTASAELTVPKARRIPLPPVPPAPPAPPVPRAPAAPEAPPAPPAPPVPPDTLAFVESFDLTVEAPDPAALAAAVREAMPVVAPYPARVD